MVNCIFVVQTYTKNMIFKYIVLAFLCIVSAWLYRRGGSDKTWHGKERDWGCSLCAIIAIVILRGGVPLTWITAFSLLGWFLLSWGALSTYWKKSGDCKWYHWLAHGLGIGWSASPLVFIGIPLWLIILRSAVLGLTMMAVSEYFDNVTAEESSRGALVVASIPILLL